MLTDFYLKSNFSEFYRQHQQMYRRAVDAARVTMADYVALDWFSSFFQKEATEDFGIIVGLNNGAGSFSIATSTSITDLHGCQQTLSGTRAT
ncbi:MAG: DUF4932 domain-containing protein [Prevotella sp.]|nr:DUF4932 domain-containing protein [Prevotella sp.]